MQRLMCGVALAALMAAPASAAGLSGDKIVIGVLTDLSGTYSDLSGAGSVAAVKMAIADFGGTVLGKPIEVISADHQNKADIAANIAKEWRDTQGVDVIVDLVNSATGLAVQAIGGEKGFVTINTGAATSRLTQKECTPTGFHWMYDTYALAHGTVPAVIKAGGDSWYFLTADYAFGASLEADSTAVIKANGGTVVGGVKHPFPSSDLSSFLLQAQASGAKVIGLANAGQDTINSIKQASEFGIVAGGQKLAALLAFSTDVTSIGLELAQGLNVTTGFYWDLDDKTREFSARFKAIHGTPPTMVQAGDYSGVLHYLKAVAAAGTDDGVTVANKMKELPVEDPVMRNPVVGANGSLIHDMYLVEVKAPAASTGPDDIFKIVATVPGAQAFQDPKDSGCPLVK